MMPSQKFDATPYGVDTRINNPQVSQGDKYVETIRKRHSHKSNDKTHAEVNRPLGFVSSRFEAGDRHISGSTVQY